MCTNVINLTIEFISTDRRLSTGPLGRLEGTLIASGIGPTPLVINGGTGDFLGAFGEFDAVFSSSDNGQFIELTDAMFDVCRQAQNLPF